ncbi:arginine repressor [Lactococcus nasutitermitis]|uniref:Arginine repressor n=1 Tax=Lactococcus nasutitermitis TaxID=1652957 RepID=A0ABV9JDB7_9LACT|nr:transcriptional regulator [Lactococcus nasutitermitis]
MKKTERLDFISRLIEKAEVKTQEELVKALLERGVDVTQATISRDIKSLALVKIPAQSGGLRYALPKNSKEQQQNVLHQELFLDAIVEVKQQENMLSILAKPGTTSLLKDYLRKNFAADIFSVIIDDDSLLVVLSEKSKAQKVIDDLTK